MYGDVVMGVVKLVGSEGAHVFQGEEVPSVVLACDAGLCELVPDKGHTKVLFDIWWKVSVGVELTPKGRAEFLELS
ncbi:hypothetical protein C4556_01280 [Candidatus Parcubacteria bacterium]|nr:MAG: hypothetical protein C4556_01280 [Candidatus Parcubacteria bacterium]